MVHNPMHQSGFCNCIHCYMENKLPTCKVALHSRAMELPTQEKFTCSPSKKKDIEMNHCLTGLMSLASIMHYVLGKHRQI
jgi:hypothetical protein